MAVHPALRHPVGYMQASMSGHPGASSESGSAAWRGGPLAGRYPVVAAMVVLALAPYLVLSSALSSLTSVIGAQLHMRPQAIGVTPGMATAGYAVATVLAVQFAQHLHQRRMLLLYGCLLVIGSVLAA